MHLKSRTSKALVGEQYVPFTPLFFLLRTLPGALLIY
jgi:hypothetical protein